MPLCDGFDATRHIRDRGHLHVPIVAVTANASAEDEEKVRELLCADLVCVYKSCLYYNEPVCVRVG